MNDAHYLPARPPDERGVTVEVTPESAGWRFSSLRVVTLSPGHELSVATGDSEWIVLPLSGGGTVTCGDTNFDLEGRTSVFERVTDFAYVPRNSAVSILSPAGGWFALAGAVARRDLPARYGAASDVPVEIRGAGSATRQVNNFAAPGAFETDRLVAVEVITPGGNWSSYPPHKHDEERPGEAVLEEVYYFEVRGGSPAGEPGPGAYHRVYSSGSTRQIDVLAEVKTGDTVLIPFGYHGPSIAAPGYDLYYLNVMAGPGEERTMSFCDDPTHAWVRDAWASQTPDPRLPMTSHRGPT